VVTLGALTQREQKAWVKINTFHSSTAWLKEQYFKAKVLNSYSALKSPIKNEESNGTGVMNPKGPLL
jgi:hypothetical protein